MHVAIIFHKLRIDCHNTPVFNGYGKYNGLHGKIVGKNSKEHFSLIIIPVRYFSIGLRFYVCRKPLVHFIMEACGRGEK